MKLTNVTLSKEESLVISVRVNAIDLYMIARMLSESYAGITKNGVVNAAMGYVANLLDTSRQVKRVPIAQALKWLRDWHMIEVKHMSKGAQTTFFKSCDNVQARADYVDDRMSFGWMIAKDVRENAEHYMTLEDGTRRYNYVKDKFRQDHGNVGCEFLNDYNYCHEEKGLKQPVETHEESFMIAQTDQPPTPIQPSEPSEPSKQIQIPEFIDSDPRLEIEKVIASLATKPNPDK